MRTCLLFIYLAISTTLFAQHNCVKGKVVDSTSRTISLVTVQIQRNNKTIKYTATDEKGEFFIDFKELVLDKLTLKISHISYATKILALKSEDLCKPLLIALAAKKNDLGEVIIQSKIGVAKIKGDTLSYNLKALTTGNEEKLRDVLKKLPGIEINEDGKITSQGKVINDLLVNGKKMFGDNHQIATDNINANMLDGVDLLSNYETFSAIKEVEGSNRTALNVKIKKEYLGKITGNLETLGAYNKRYQAHSNLFKFNKRANVTSIIDANNTGYQPLSAKDYFSMSKSVRQDLRNNDAAINSLPSAEDIPAFLRPDENVASKKNEFASFDLAYQPNSKLSLNGFTILNKIKTDELIASTRLFLDINQNVSINENTNRKNRFFYNQSKFNIDYKPHNNTLWNYTVLFDFNINYLGHSIFNNMNDSLNHFLTNEDRLAFSLGHQLSFINKIAKNKLLSFNLFHESKNQHSDLDIHSNTKLFNISSRYLQNNRVSKNDFGFYAKYTQKIKQLLVRASTGWVNESSRFNSINPTTVNGISKLDLRYFFLEISLQKKTGKFNYNAKIEARPYFIQALASSHKRFVVLPTLQVKYHFSQTDYLFGGYNRVVDFPRIEKLNDFFYAEDFRTFITSSPVAFNTVLQQDVLSLNYFKFNLYNGTIILVNTAYTRYGKKISNNTAKMATYNETSPIVTNSQYSWNNTISFEKRLSKWRNKFRVAIGYMKSDFINQINSLENNQNATFINFRTALLSNFEKKFFNYEVAFNFSSQQTEASLFKQGNAVKRITPSVSFDGVIKENWSYRLDNAYEKFTSGNITTKFYNLGCKFKYKAKKFQYWIEGNNILNINNPEVIKVSNNNNIFSTEIVNRLAGYIGIGIGLTL